MRIGVDLMSVSRFARVAEHPRYRTLVFTERELAEAGQLGSARSVERLAGRFCVKEATCKLLGRGYREKQGRPEPGSWIAGAEAAKAFLTRNHIDAC